METIRGGYYIKARKIQESEIAFAPPHVREIWDWLIKECNHKDSKKINRGQCVRTIKDIQEGLKWYVGYRKMSYKKYNCEMALNRLRKLGMITTTKTTRGMIITVCNYDTYQNPKNYDSSNENTVKATTKQQTTDTINKNVKNAKNVKTIVDYLNNKLKTNYNPTTVDTKKHINARLNESFTINNFKLVIDFKIKEWGSNAEMSQYLRPSTLFGTKFESYLQAANNLSVPERKIYHQFICPKKCKDDIGYETQYPSERSYCRICGTERVKK